MEPVRERVNQSLTVWHLETYNDKIWQFLIISEAKMKWRYFSAYYLVKREGLLGRKVYRVLDIDGTEYELLEGLNFLGQQGWELVAVQQLDEAYGGTMGDCRDLNYLYLFKKPLS
jgi:hypothetical protein